MMASVLAETRLKKSLYMSSWKTKGSWLDLLQEQISFFSKKSKLFLESTQASLLEAIGCLLQECGNKCVNLTADLCIVTGQE
jgi:hypothetical protein